MACVLTTKERAIVSFVEYDSPGHVDLLCAIVVNVYASRRPSLAIVPVHSIVHGTYDIQI